MMLILILFNLNLRLTKINLFYNIFETLYTIKLIQYIGI
jgi:hypothetical protein